MLSIKFYYSTHVIVCMIKNQIVLVLSFFIFFFLGCSSSKPKIVKIQISTDSLFKVYKLDSISNYYIIYAVKQGGKHKIISKMEFGQEGIPIKKDSFYGFNTHSLLYNFEGKDVAMGGLVGCVYVDSVSKVCIEDSIKDLEIANNVKGLIYLNNVK